MSINVIRKGTFTGEMKIAPIKFGKGMVDSGCSKVVWKLFSKTCVSLK